MKKDCRSFSTPETCLAEPEMAWRQGLGRGGGGGVELWLWILTPNSFYPKGLSVPKLLCAQPDILEVLCVLCNTDELPADSVPLSDGLLLTLSPEEQVRHCTSQ